MEHSGSFKNEAVCITGGTGFVGSYLSRRLVNEGASVSIITEEGSSPALIDDIRDKIDIHLCDITDFNSLNGVLQETRPSLVYHLAAKIDTGTGPEVIATLNEVNHQGTINMLKASKESVVKRFIYFSTSDVYGPTEESCSEDSPPDPISPYGTSKAAAELSVRQCDIPWVILRPFIIYGGGQSHNMFIPQLIRSVLKGEDFSMTAGEQTRDFLYIDDFVDACIRSGLSKEAEREIINIASGKETPLADVAKNVMSQVDHPAKIRLGALPYRENERWHVKADIEKADRLLGWKPMTNLIDGLKKTIHWYNN